MPSMVSTGRTCRRIPQRSAGTQLRATCAAWGADPVPWKCWLSLHDILLFPFCLELRAALGSIWAVSGRKWLSVGSWILTSFAADVRGCREQREEKGKSGRKDQRVLSGETLLKVSAEL